MKLFSHLWVLSVVSVSVLGTDVTANGSVTDAVDERGIEKFTLSDFGNDNRGNSGNGDRGKDGDSDDFAGDGFTESGKAEKGKPIQAIDPNSLNRLEKVFGNINQWIKDHAGKYKKRGKMIDITKRLKNRFETSLKLEPCRNENDEEYRSFGFIDDVEELGEESELAARGGPETPQAKAAKYAKVLNKIKKEYLGDCKKVQRISQRIQRIESAMLDALLKQKIVSKKTADRFNSKQAKRTQKLEKKKSKALRRGETFEMPADMAPTYEPDTTTVEDITKYFHFV